MAAASVGGLHIAEVVDVPGLPDANRQTVVATQDVAEIEDESTEAGPEADSEFPLA